MNNCQVADIIARVKNGDRAAFETIVLSYQTLLFRVVRNLVGDGQAEDVVQEVFLAAYANLKRFDPQKGGLKTWLLTIARNKARNTARRKREYTGMDLPEARDERSPSDALLAKERFAQLDGALLRLNDQERMIFVLAEIEGLSYAEIARIENMRLGSVKSKLSRTRAKLRALIKKTEATR